MSYGLAKTFSRDPDSFGKGNIAGVAAPEAANNAASTGSMLPMITLGIPGSPTTAILLGGMIIWGLRPGPLLFTEHPDFVWGLIGSLYIANLVALLINLAFIPLFVRILTLPFTILAPTIYVLCVVGGYAPTQTMHDVWLMFLFGVAGYFLRKLNYPVAPAVLGHRSRTAGGTVASSVAPRLAGRLRSSSWSVRSRQPACSWPSSWSPSPWCAGCSGAIGAGRPGVREKESPRTVIRNPIRDLDFRDSCILHTISGGTSRSTSTGSNERPRLE